MKNIAFALAIYFFHITAITAQENSLATFRFGFPQTGNQGFFARNPAVSHVIVGFQADTPASVSLHFRTGISESFHLTSAEDKGLLNKKYGSFELPSLPRVAVGFYADMTGPQEDNTYYDVRSTVTKDSVFYRFSHWYKPDTSENRGTHTSTNAIVPFPGDPLIVRKLVTKKYKGTVGGTGNDSLFSFSAAIQEDGTLLDVALSTGISSELTEHIVSELRAAGDARVQGTTGRRAGKKRYIHMYARLNHDGTVTLLTNRRVSINGGGLQD